MHWAESYVGQPYIDGVNDCASFAVKVQYEVFDRAITLPTERAIGLRGQSQQIQAHRADYAESVSTPIDGDAVLMRGRGRLNHIGIYCRINGVQYVLHAMKNAGQVCLHRIRDLPSIGLQLEGFYRWLR